MHFTFPYKTCVINSVNLDNHYVWCTVTRWHGVIPWVVLNKMSLFVYCEEKISLKNTHTTLFYVHQKYDLFPWSKDLLVRGFFLSRNILIMLLNVSRVFSDFVINKWGEKYSQCKMHMKSTVYCLDSFLWTIVSSTCLNHFPLISKLFPFNCYQFSPIHTGQFPWV